MDRPNEGIAEAGENEAPLLMTCSGGTSVIKDLHTIDLARCVVDVSRVQLLDGLRAVATSRYGIQLDGALYWVTRHLGYLVSSPCQGYMY